MQALIKWTGSKRLLAKVLCDYVPSSFNNYHEPFLGSGSMMYAISPQTAFLSDKLPELISLWHIIQHSPEDLITSYIKNWELLQHDKSYYYEVRKRFNLYRSPLDFFFLLRTCVNGLVRFNNKQEFNVALHHKRFGIHPNRLIPIIKDWSNKIQDYSFECCDYQSTIDNIHANDFVYLDPPYCHSTGIYQGNIDYERLMIYLEQLHRKKAKYLLSFDGTKGDVDFTNIFKIPKELYKRHVLLNNHFCGFKKLSSKGNEPIRENVYMNF